MQANAIGIGETVGSTAVATASKRLAAIDIGSNSIRLLVAEAFPDGSYQVLDDEKQTTRLARGLAQDGLLTQEAMNQSLDALSRMKVIAAGYNVERLEVIATSAVREAANREQFLDLVAERLGIQIEVISPEEEGQLSFTSVARQFDLSEINAAIVDLGGGSAEVILAAQGVIESNYSFPIGAVRLTEGFIHSDPPMPDELRRLKKNIRKRFRETAGAPEFLPHVMIGAGGTFTALANISMRRRGDAASRPAGYELTRSEVKHIFEHMKNLPLASRRAVPGLHADRADIILAGLVVIEQLMKLLGVNRLLIHDQGVRDGLMLRTISRVFKRPITNGQEESDPLAGVRQFAAACGHEPKHAEQVARLALQLFDQLQTRLKLPAEERLLLEAAALLHEVGCLIHYEKHHQHSYHLIMHGNVRGLSSRQRELVANVARYHRKSGPKNRHENFARLRPEDRETVRRLSAILRIADGLDRTHTQQVQAIRCRWRTGKVLFEVTAETMPDVDLWGAEFKRKLFEKVFDVKTEFEWAAPVSEPSTTSPERKRAVEPISNGRGK